VIITERESKYTSAKAFMQSNSRNMKHDFVNGTEHPWAGKNTVVK